MRDCRCGALHRPIMPCSSKAFRSLLMGLQLRPDVPLRQVHWDLARSRRCIRAQTVVHKYPANRCSSAVVDDDRVYLGTVFLEIQRDSVCRRRHAGDYSSSGHDREPLLAGVRCHPILKRTSGERYKGFPYIYLGWRPDLRTLAPPTKSSLGCSPPTPPTRSLRSASAPGRRPRGSCCGRRPQRCAPNIGKALIRLSVFPRSVNQHRSPETQQLGG